MSIIADAIGQGVGNGMAAFGQGMQARDTAEARNDVMQYGIDSKLSGVLAQSQLRYEAAMARINEIAQRSGGKQDVLSDMLAQEIGKAGGVAKVTGTDLTPTDPSKFTKTVPGSWGDGEATEPPPDTTVPDTDAYNAAESARQRKVEQTMLMVRDPAAYKGFQEGKAQDIANTVAEMALKNPKMSVGELADRLSLLKPGEDRLAASGGIVYNRAGVGGPDNDGIVLDEAGAKAKTGGDTGEERKTWTSLIQTTSQQIGKKSDTIKSISAQIPKMSSKDAAEARASIKALQDDIRALEAKNGEYQRNLVALGGTSSAGTTAPTIAGSNRGRPDPRALADAFRRNLPTSQ